MKKKLASIIALVSLIGTLNACDGTGQPLSIKVPVDSLFSQDPNSTNKDPANFLNSPNNTTSTNTITIDPSSGNMKLDSVLFARFGLQGAFKKSPDNNGEAYHVTGDPELHGSIRLPGYSSPTVLRVDPRSLGQLMTASMEIFIPQNSNLKKLEIGLRFYTDIDNNARIGHGGGEGEVDEFKDRIEISQVYADINTTDQYQLLTINSTIPVADAIGNPIEMFDINLFVAEVGAEQNADNNQVSFHIRNVLFKAEKKGLF